MNEPAIDRVAPTLRPAGRTALLRQRWEHLLFLHWEVPVASLRPLVPASLEIDTFEGRAYVGLVPFRIRGTRLSDLFPLPFAVEFDEVNVRTYVHRGGHDPGVWFFSLDATSLPAVLGARAVYHLPYHHASIDCDVSGEGPSVQYSARRRGGGDPAVLDVTYRPHGNVVRAASSTFEHFLLERYLLYSESGGTLRRARVHHESYPARAAEVHLREETLVLAAGVRRPGDAPIAHYASSVDVEIFAPDEVG